MTEVQGTLIAELTAAGYPGFCPAPGKHDAVCREVDKDGVRILVHVFDIPGGTAACMVTPRVFAAASRDRSAVTMARLAGRLQEAGVGHLLRALEAP